MPMGFYCEDPDCSIYYPHKHVVVRLKEVPKPKAKVEYFTSRGRHVYTKKNREDRLAAYQDGAWDGLSDYDNYPDGWGDD